LEQLFEHSFFTKNLDITMEFSTKNMCGNNKQCHVTLFALVWHVELGSTIFLTFSLIMRSITPAQHSTMITLLQEGYTYSKIQTKTGLGKATISRVKAEALADKENNLAGYPSKLTTHDK
jgi:Trp repressor protein